MLVKSNAEYGCDIVWYMIHGVGAAHVLGARALLGSCRSLPVAAGQGDAACLPLAAAGRRTGWLDVYAYTHAARLESSVTN